jgi:hypothetical protein
MPVRPPARIPEAILQLQQQLDQVDIFVNGQKVFQGDATHISRDIQFLGTVSMRGAMTPRLKKGASQVCVKVKENYGGWALTGGDFDPGRASAYISHAMALYRPERSSPTV